MVHSLSKVRAISMARLMSRFWEDLSPPQQKQIDHFSATRVIDAVARPGMREHFRDALTHRLTVAKIAVLGRADAQRDPGAADLVFHGGEPSVELLGSQKRVQLMSVSEWILSCNDELPRLRVASAYRQTLLGFRS